jgi:hypothetical protein
MVIWWTGRRGKKEWLSYGKQDELIQPVNTEIIKF